MSSPVRFIAERLSRQLQTGDAPWQQVWQQGSSYLPMNPATGQAYRAINAVSLAAAAIDAGWTDPRWMTEAQAIKLGGIVQAGQPSSPIIAWQFEQRLSDGQKVRLEKPRLTVHAAFNAEQIDGLPPYEPKLFAADQVAAWITAIIQGSKACTVTDANGGPSRYDAERDLVLLKDRTGGPAHIRQIEVIHALAHWTGHGSRLDRDIIHPIGTSGHAREEHRTNIASMILGDRLGIGWHPGTHAALGPQWVALIENDPTEILRATQAAEKIVERVMELGRERDRTLEIERNRSVKTQVTQDHPAITRPANISSRRTYLVVPFAEKDQAKGLGAKFDREHKAWFVPANLDAKVFDAWMPHKATIHIATARDVCLVFANELKKAGFRLDPGDPRPDGKIHHARVEGNKGNERSGSYRLYADGVPNGWYQNFKIHDEAVKWVMPRDQAQTITPAVRETINALSAQSRQDAAEAQQQGYDQAAAALQQIWDKAIAPTGHAYLTSKGITAAPEVRIAGPDAKLSVERKRDDRQSEPWMTQQGGINALNGPLRESAERSYTKWAEASPELGRKYSLGNYVTYVQDKWAEEDRKAERAELADISLAGRLLVPMHNIDGELRSLQIIDDQGQKMFARGGEAVGSHLVLGDAKSAWPLHFCEGYATGKAIHQATGQAVVVTFSAYNLAPVAAAYRERYPERTFFIDADNDHRKARERDSQDRQKKNTGKERAESAAKLVDGYMLLPPFSETDSGKDWDDYQRDKGKNALAMELTNQMAAGSRNKIAKEIEASRNYGQSTRERTPARVR